MDPNTPHPNPTTAAPKATEVHWLMESRFGLDGGAMFGIVPKPLWSRTNPADDANRIEMTTRCLVVRHPDAGVILVDTGMGTDWSPKERSIYKLRHTNPQADAPDTPLGLDAGLARLGLTRDDVDHVVLTHLHFDHAGGLTRLDSNGDRVPSFPGRPHHLLRENWSRANAPTERDAGSYRAECFRWLEDDPHGATLHLHDGWTELFDGFTLIPRRGHTPGMACVKIDTPTATWLHLADLIPTAGHLKIPYVMGYDLDPVTTCREKREILSEAARHGWRLIFEHDPDTAWSRVEATNRGQWRAVRDAGEA